MAIAKKKAEKKVEIVVPEIFTESISVRIVGKSPLIFNAMSEKARQELLLPRKKLTSSEKEVILKHDPLKEYRDSPYTYETSKRKTRLYMPSTAFKKSMSSAALDLSDVEKAVMGRLTWVEGDTVPIYGVPQMFMVPVRLMGPGRSADIRTRAILSEWACEFTIHFVSPKIKARSIANLLAAAGLIRGVGDWRIEKGSGDYGQYMIVGDKDRNWARIVKAGGFKAQDAALEEPSYYDNETRKLYEWYIDERKRREMEKASRRRRVAAV